MDAVVQIPAYEEGPRVQKTAKEITRQIQPANVDVDVEAWVTPSPADKELCDTWQHAMRTSGIDVFEAPPGKLSARNKAHAHAVAEDYDIIATWDADAPPLTNNTLRALFEPFDDPNVAAVNARPVAAPEPDLIGRLTDLTGFALDRINPHMHGQCSAFRAAAWQRVGPFDESIDQTDSTAVRQEEEFELYDKFAEIGEVVGASDAMVFNDTRRTRCRIPLLGDPEFCDRMSGSVTFEPRDRH